MSKITGYIKRNLEKVLLQACGEFPAVVLTGPRQSGKTTLLKQLFAKTHQYISLEPPDIRAAAEADPRGFLARFSPPVIFDEVQYAPTLLPYIKEIIDQHRQETGRFLLTGSQNLLMMQQITESLAGRAAMLHLMPLSYREMLGAHEQAFPWERTQDDKSHTNNSRTLSSDDLWRTILRGSFPELAANPQRNLQLWHSSYIQTYLERDVRSLRQVGDLTLFQAFLRALAARNGGLLNITELSRELGVAVNTIKNWLSVLEASFQIIILRPYFANISKRLVKTPKVYFADTGTLCYLVGLQDAQHAAAGPMAGGIFESVVLMEIIKTMMHRGQTPEVYFWRTASNGEVDFLVKSGEKLIPLEVKLSATPRPNMAHGIHTLQRDLGDRIAPGYVIHPGEVTLPLGEGVMAMPFNEL